MDGMNRHGIKTQEKKKIENVLIYQNGNGGE